jgi:hypothetical protein
MSDGTIYAFDGSVPSFTSIGSVTAGARMAYANDRVYVFYRNMTAPTSGNTVRKVIEYDYSAGTFSISDILVQEYFTVGDVTEVDHGYTGNVESYYSKFVYTDLRNDNSESKGVEVYQQSDKEYQYAVKVTKSTGFYGLRCYGSIKNLVDDVFLTPGFLFEIKDGPSYVPVTDGNIWGNAFASAADEIEVVKTNGSGVSDESFLSWILDQYDSGTKYIDVGHKIKVFGTEYTIVTITKDTATPPLVKYTIELDANIPTFVMGLTEYLTGFVAGGSYVLLEVQLDFVSNVIYLPIMRRFRELFGVPVDENRPESNFTSGTGNLLAPLGNYLFTANPYFPDLFGVGEDLDKKGWLSWSWITGEGLYAFGLLPDVSLITSPSFSSEIIDMIDFKENLLVFHKGGLVRFVLENGVPFPFDSDEDGVDDDFNYYRDNFRFFIYSNQKIKQAVFTRQNIEKGEIRFAEISRIVASLVKSSSGVDARFCYEPEEKLLYFTDIDGNVSSYICSLRDGRPKWIKHVNTYGAGGAEVELYNSFVLNGTVYFVGDDAGTYKVWKMMSI